MSKANPEQSTMLSVWQQHLYAEFKLKNAEAALATMTENPHVLLIPSGTGGTGKEGVRDFYVNHFLPYIPPDIEMIPVSETSGHDRFVGEYVVRFTHTLDMDWFIPGVPSTDREVEFVLVVIVQFENGKMASEHLYWDQASLLSQLGILATPAAAAGIASAARLTELTAQSRSAEYR
ncbi:MAG TPA: nuclear transport factor 2 family protein [Blastocatellia bacterium]|nr:nuclear transport factor 2 family protein [Blastocatellia bacterium]